MPDPSVLLVVRDLDFGGIQLMALRMLRGLPLPTRLCVLAERRVLGVEDVPAGDDAEALKTLGLARPMQTAGGLGQAAFLAGQVRRLRPSVVLPLGYSTTALATVSVGPRLVSGARNSPVELDGPGMRAMAKRLWVRLGLRRAARVVCISEALAAELRERGWVRPDRLAVVHNGVDVERVKQLASASPSVALPDWYAVTVGRLSQQKDVGLLLDACGRIDRLHLVVVGDGPGRASLMTRAAQLGIDQRVHFLGALDNPFPVVRGAAVFALASRYEGFATVLVEALALGVPVASVDCPSGPREILDGNAFGELAETRTAAALADALTRAMARTDELRTNGPSRAAQFSLDAMLHGYADIVHGAFPPFFER